MGVKTRKRKLKNGRIKKTYQAEVYFQGEVVERKSFDTEGAAWAFHDDRLRQYRTGNSSDERNDVLFRDLVDAYRERELPLKRKSTQQSMSVRLKYFYDGPLALRKVSNLTVRDIDKWFNWLHEHPTTKNPTRTSFNKELTILRILLYWFRDEFDFRFSVPVVKKHSRRAAIPGAKKKRKDSFIRKDEIPVWLESLSKLSVPVFHDLGLFLVLTGVRLGEACGLLWEDIDLTQRTVSISKAIAWDLNTKAPYDPGEVKTPESIRVVSLPDPLIPMLKSRFASRPRPDAPVFCDRNGNWMRQTKIYDRFTQAFRNAGLKWTGARITRHTFASMGLAANDGNISAIQATLGHTNRRTTEVYAKASQHLFNNVADRTADYIGL